MDGSNDNVGRIAVGSSLGLLPSPSVPTGVVALLDSDEGMDEMSDRSEMTDREEVNESIARSSRFRSVAKSVVS